jgi:predicted nucleic acid-binding protein
VASIVVDTDILIDVARGDNTAIGCLQSIKQQFQLATSVVTQMELIVGCRNKVELNELEKFLQHFQILKLTEQITDRAVDLLRQYRLSHGLLIADALIASTALEYDEAFITKNQRDYRFIPSLKLLTYP